MFLYKLSKEPIFWNGENENKPSLSYFNSYIKDMIPAAGININFDSFFSGTTTLPTKDYKYLSVYDDELDETKYFFIKSISRILKNGYVVDLQLDIYTSYVIDFLEKNKETDFMINRSHLFDDKSVQLNDDLLDSIPLVYDSVEAIKIKYPRLANKNETYFYNEKTYIKYNNKDIRNGNKYYVFNDGDAGSYTFLPILTDFNNLVEIGKEKEEVGDLIYTDVFSAQTNESWEISTIKHKAKIDTILKDAYENNKIIKWYYKDYIVKIESTANDINNPDNWKYVEFFPSFNTYTANFTRPNTNDWWWIVAGTMYDTRYDIYLNGIFLFNNLVRTDYSTIGNLNRPNKPDKIGFNFQQIKIEVYDRKITKTNKFNIELVNNSLEKLEKIKFSQEWSNKFLGIYYLPNIINMDRDFRFQKLIESNTLYFSLKPNGNTIRDFKLLEIDFSPLKYNNPTISNINILKYLKVKYYDNNISVALRLNENNLVLGGILQFSQNGFLISKSPLLSLSNSIIGYGYQLPSSTDNYRNYVNANMNSANNSYRIAKQEMQMGIASSAVNMGFDGISNMGTAASAMGDGGIGKVVSSVSSTYQGLFNGGMNIANQVLKKKNMEKTMRAQYADKKNQLGNTISPSNISDSSLVFYNDDGDYYESLEINNLSKTSVIMLNNILFLYGNFLPQLGKLKTFLDIDFNGFRYIEFDGGYLAMWLKQQNFELNVISLIIGELTSGVRIWDKVPVLEDYVNPPIPEIPPPVYPEIPPPINPPLLPDTNIGMNIITDFGSGLKVGEVTNEMLKSNSNPAVITLEIINVLENTEWYMEIVEIVPDTGMLYTNIYIKNYISNGKFVGEFTPWKYSRYLIIGFKIGEVKND